MDVLKRRKFLIGGIIISMAISYLGFTGFQSSATYYLTVGEFFEQGNLIYGENIRVNGLVDPGSIVKEPLGRTMKFTVTEEDKTLPVVYQGIVPDTFKTGINVVVEGTVDSDGVFQAHTLLPKCPSRYEAQEEAQG